MIDLFNMGGSLFMGVLTLLLLVMIVIAVRNALLLLNNNPVTDSQLSMLKSVGLFAMVFGVLGQFLGLYAAFEMIEQMGGISQPMLMGGLKVSSITTIYGLIIYLFSYLIWFGESAWNRRL